MKNKNTILVGVDYSKSAENALMYAALLASKTGSALMLMHVFDIPVLHTNSGIYFISYESIKEEHQNHLEKYKQLVLKKYPKMEVKTFVTSMSFKSEIKDLSNSKKIQYVVLGLETKSKIARFIYGTTSLDIAGKVDCPVIIVPQKYKEHKLSKTVLAVDNAEATKSKLFTKFVKFNERFKAKPSYVHIKTEDELNLGIKPVKKGKPEIKIEELESKSFVLWINRYVRENEVDLVTVVSQSHSLIYNLFSERNTKLIAFQSKIPVMSLHE